MPCRTKRCLFEEGNTVAKMRKRKIGLIIAGIIVLLIVLLFNSHNISYYILTPKYEYCEENGRDVINMDGIIYEEISVLMFERIYDDMVSKGIDPFDDDAVGRMDYIDAGDIWKFWIYGKKEVEQRILLKGHDAYVLHDANYPEVYFCREDVLKSYQEQIAED